MNSWFYKSTKWKRKRAVILRRDEYVCQESRRYGKTEPATTVHHIYPIEFYPELALVNWNLVSLSDKQHNAMHDRVTHELTALGLAWQERVRDKFEEWQGKGN
ncbi:5-methylcytosine-specific restriction protein A [Paenibacillus sp. 4624]|uniref:HNH endonuclease n=1 Tax=Paenibacillus cucumis (ex Kampfer et al. 2016) TaxID=1776858 RepID=A0ABS7KCZ6_9BACL|nr:HNH endonuclease [Paenibacillus cucumis (ex Kampfer et al. 2016)]MBY0202010.1 HNH endonuclease [Paenibacillus cucumis (ex Kampfer et al. 2016)]